MRAKTKVRLQVAAGLAIIILLLWHSFGYDTDTFSGTAAVKSPPDAQSEKTSAQIAASDTEAGAQSQRPFANGQGETQGEGKDSSITTKPSEPNRAPRTDLEYMGLERLEETVEFAKLRVHVDKAEVTPALEQGIDAVLPTFSTKRLTDEAGRSKSTAETSIMITVSSPEKKRDASHLMFGLATSLERLPDALKNFEYWAKDTGARFIISVEPYYPGNPAQPSPDDIRALYKDHGVQLVLIEAAGDWASRYVSLLTHLSVHANTRTKWTALIDDDTFFFGMSSLLSTLEKYDPSQPWYLGRMSENKVGLNENGIFAQGGAGAFFSTPLLRQISPHADECNMFASPYGDTRVGECVYRFSSTATKLTLEYGFFQLDMFGDPSGFYEAVRPRPVSVHHWKSWHHHDWPTMATVSQVCGYSCVLQKYVFSDGWKWANGFSIYKYGYSPAEIASQVSGAMEKTFAPSLGEESPATWLNSFEPLKPRDEQKVQYYLEKTATEADGSVSQYYVRRKDGVGKGIIHVVWSSK